MSKPLAELADPELKPNVGGMAGMAFGFLCLAIGMAMVVVAALSVRDQELRIADLQQEQAKLRRDVQELEDTAALAETKVEALTDAVVGVAIEARKGRTPE